MSEQPEHGRTPSDAAREHGRAAGPDEGADESRYVVVTPDGMGVATGPTGADSGDDDGSAEQDETGRREESRHGPVNPADLVERPAKVMRIGAMVKQLLDEVRSAPLDDRGRARLAAIHARSIAELKDGLAPELVAELDRITLPFRDGVPSDAELRIAQAQLVGWLEGLFHGIQTALVAQQMAAQAQLQQIRALPPGMRMPGQAGPGSGSGSRPQGSEQVRPDGPGPSGTGQYL